MNIRKRMVGLPFLLALASCVQVPKSIQFDETIPYTEINGYKFHTEIFGKPEAAPIIVIHGGPGGDYEYLKPLQKLSKDYRVIFYDQRGTGLSPRVDKKHLTLEQNLDDLNAIVEHFANGGKVKLIGHSWGGMLIVGYLSKYPEKVSRAVVVEPGMLHPASARAFVKIMKESQSIADAFALAGYVLMYPFVSKDDGHEGFDYVMTKLLNRNKPGAPYQCAGQAMPPGIFKRAGYEAFSNMMKPVMDNPDSFTYDLTDGISRYRGDLMLIGSDCSVIGYAYQQIFYIPKFPEQTVHVKAANMGHNMLTLNPEWSLQTIGRFFKP
jgi:proline iminopeptidase